MIAGTRNRVQALVQFVREPTLAEECGGLDDPGGRVRVLGPVLSSSRQIALDVAGIMGPVFERRREQEDQPVLAVNKPLLDRLHRTAAPLGIGGP